MPKFKYWGNYSCPECISGENVTELDETHLQCLACGSVWEA